MFPSIRNAALALALGAPLALAACRPSTTPTPPIDDQGPHPVPIQQVHVREKLDAAAEALARAEADGQLTPSECTAVSQAFRDAYHSAVPASVFGIFNAAVVLDLCHMRDDAVKMYEEVIAKAPKYFAAYNNLGVLHWQAQRVDDAVDAFNRAIRLDPKATEPRNNLAAALRHRYRHGGDATDFQRAEKTLRTALALDTDNRLAYENLARLYYDRGREGERSYLLLADLVITQGTRILQEQDQASAELHNLRGLLLMEDGDQIRALRAFQQATRVDAEHPEAHLNIAMIALRFRDYATAETSLRQALDNERHREDVVALLGLGVAQRGLRDFDGAEQTLLTAQKLDTTDPRALYNLGILYHEHIAPLRSQVPKKGGDEGETEFDGTPFRDAQQYFRRFAAEAGDRYPVEAADARDRIANIDQLLEDVTVLADLEAEQARMEAQWKEEQEREKLRLREIERRARKAHEAGAGT
ncbi:MAG: tetratricopeptide repeat protein [Myxococcota bacterium]